MIRLIAFKLLQMKCTSLVFRFSTVIQNKEIVGKFSFFVMFTHSLCGFAIAFAQFITDSYQVESSTTDYQFAIFPLTRNLNRRDVFIIFLM